MRLRSYIASLLLTVYLVSVCGYALTVILCHCHRSEHYIAHHTQHHSCHHCHTAAADGIRVDSHCNCFHKHTTEIDLYDVAKVVNPLVAPLVCDIIIPAFSTISDCPTEVTNARFLQRKIPLPHSVALSASGLRAPPVSA